MAWRWRLFAVALLAALTVPRMTQRGMFLDGMTYAVVARNMAVGVGTLWAPSVSATTYQQFYEQPPLGMAIESAAFRLLGDRFFVERVCALMAFGLSAFLICAIWRQFWPAQYDWMPLLFWILPSVVTWGVVNNMLENIQTVFTCLAVLAMLSATRSSSAAAAAAWSITGGIATVAAALVKGPVGLFPLAVPPLLWLIRPSGRRLRLGACWVVGWTVTALALGGLLLYEPSRRSIGLFLQTHLAPAMRGDRGSGWQMFDLSRHLILGIWARMGILAALIWIATRRHARPVSDWRAIGFFLALGLSASVPILASPVMAGHYFIPSIPFFALAAGGLMTSRFGANAARGSLIWRVRVPTVAAAVLIVATVAVPLLYGSIEPRNRALISGLDGIAAAVPRGHTIGSCTSARTDFGLQTYLQRFFRVSVAPDGTPVNGWFLIAGSSCEPPPECLPAAAGPTIALYRCDRR